jgi:hypothetical protein
VVEIRYPMAFNDIAEGWSWNPQADRALQDYYTYKYLPLLSVVEERGEYEGEDKIGEIEHPAEMRIGRTGHVQFDAEGMAVKARTLVAGRYVRQAMRGFERKDLENVHRHSLAGPGRSQSVASLMTA